jgi:hypothetical protein
MKIKYRATVVIKIGKGCMAWLPRFMYNRWLHFIVMYIVHM